MKVVDPGHVYELDHLGGRGSQTIRFVKRSGGAAVHDEEWDGLQTQEVLRALIDRTDYLFDILPCVESGDAAWHLRMALFEYEARAYRRKQEDKNRKTPAHDDTERPRSYRDRQYADVPFDETDIETRPIGLDGHIVLDGMSPA